MPAAVVRRIVRFHLVDNTRGEPPLWRSGDIKVADVRGRVTEADAGHVLVKYEGRVLAATGEDVASAARGYDAALLGYVRYCRAKDRVDRFDWVALGDHWGEGKFTAGARPGRTPLGVAFELADGTKPADAVPPQGAREEGEYFAR
jgi:hypothetical protein